MPLSGTSSPNGFKNGKTPDELIAISKRFLVTSKGLGGDHGGLDLSSLDGPLGGLGLGWESLQTDILDSNLDSNLDHVEDMSYSMLNMSLEHGELKGRMVQIEEPIPEELPIGI